MKMALTLVSIKGLYNKERRLFMKKNDELLQITFEGVCNKLTYLGLGETK